MFHGAFHYFTEFQSLFCKGIALLVDTVKWIRFSLSIFVISDPNSPT